MKTLNEWQEGNHGDFDSYVNQYDEIDSELYWYFLEILPPIYCQNGFLVSEPYSYCAAYETQTYSCFVKYCDRFYWLGNISPKAVNDETENLLNRLKVKAANNDFVFNDIGELINQPADFTWLDLSKAYTKLIIQGENIKASRIQHLCNIHYPLEKRNLFNKVVNHDK